MAITLTRTRTNGALVAGDTETLAATATDAAGTAINLTGYAIAYRMTDGDTALVSKSLSSGVAVVSASAGTFTVTLDPADTDGRDPGTYRHACAVTSGAGVVTTVFRGRLRITRITAAAGILRDYQD